MTTWASFAPTKRPDLLLEHNDLTDSGGNYTTPWVDSIDAVNVRVLALVNGGSSPTVTLQEGMYSTSDSTGPVLVGDRPVPSLTSGLAGYVRYAELPLTARYFRLVIASGGDSTSVSLSVRSI